jgi:predicted RND superfamily exporter protein
LLRRIAASLLALGLGWAALEGCAAPARAAPPVPTSIDCAAMPCAAVLPAAQTFRRVESAPYWEGLDADSEVVGWVALSTDFVEVKAYSGKPLVTLVGLDREGIITGAQVVHHSEPILLVGIPEQALHDFVAFYAGKSALQRVVVGRSDQAGAVSVDVPVIVELIRRSLYRDLVVFSLAAVLVFGLIIGLVYRDVAIVVGTLATCFTAVSVTLIAVRAIGVPIGLLTANLVTIVFVIALSHVVFLTTNWKRRAAAESDRSRALSLGIHDTLEGSFWSMTATLLGFLSLLVASAKPLRDLGIAGSVGTITGFAVTYALFPAFIARWAKVRPFVETSLTLRAASRRRGIVIAIAAVAVVAAAGMLRVNTDPGLLTYFGEGTPLREGLDQIDSDGGSSTLDIVVRDPAGGRLDAPEGFTKLEDLHAALEEDPAVGVALSPTVLVGHARTLPLAALLPTPMLLDVASSPQQGGVGLGYITAERDEAHYFLRMHESGREESRQAVLDRLSGYAEDSGLEPVAVAGLYDLQAQLGRLIASSLVEGIGGLLVLFLGVAFIVSRSPGTALKMWATLVGIPAVVLGTFGYLGIAVDIITSPAANVALGLGSDAMIHLVVRVRRLTGAGDSDPWTHGVAQIGRAVIGATGIVAAGFGIFVLSTFPPTQRFGLAVILGTTAAAALALVVLPGLHRRVEAPAVEL